MRDARPHGGVRMNAADCDDWKTGHYGQRRPQLHPTVCYCRDCGSEVEWDLVSDGWYCAHCGEDKGEADVTDMEPDEEGLR